MARSSCVGRPASKWRAIGQPTASAFTLIELLVVVAIISMLAALLLPALREARKAGLRAACLSNLHQLAVSATTYQGDYSGYYPLFGGPPSTDGYGRYLNDFCPWSFTGPAITVFTNSYLGTTSKQPGTGFPRVMYCPTVDWTQFGAFNFINPSVCHYSRSPGYLFYTGRKMHNSTWANHDTILRRNDPAEVLMTDQLMQATQNEDWSGPPWNLQVSTTVAWFNPHVDRSCAPTPKGVGHQVLADGSVVRFDFARVTNFGIPYYAMSWGRLIRTGSDATSSISDGPYYVWDGLN